MKGPGAQGTRLKESRHKSRSKRSETVRSDLRSFLSIALVPKSGRFEPTKGPQVCTINRNGPSWPRPGRRQINSDHNTRDPRRDHAVINCTHHGCPEPGWFSVAEGEKIASTGQANIQLHRR